MFRSGARLSGLVGRDDQLGVLERELAETIKGDGRVVGVVGEAGIGKSRLCFEFAENCRRRGIRVFEARVLAHGRATPFQPVLALLRDIFGVQAKESAEVSRQRVTRRFSALPDSEPLLLVLLEFLGLSDPARPAVKTDQKRARCGCWISSGFSRFPSPGEIATVTFFIEDLHWIDTASEEFIEAFANAVIRTKNASARQFQARLHRALDAEIALPADQHAAARDGRSTTIVAGMLRRRRVAGVAGAQYHRARPGNPFFLFWKNWSMRWSSAATSKATEAAID